MTTRAAVGAVAVVLAAGLAAADEPTKNEKIVAFAKGKLGEQVGNGECWTLAHEAVKAAGAKSSGAYKDSPAKGDYVWGKLVYGVGIKDGKLYEENTTDKLKPEPGDIIQFRDAKFEGKLPGGDRGGTSPVGARPQGVSSNETRSRIHEHEHVHRRGHDLWRLRRKGHQPGRADPRRHRRRCRSGHRWHHAERGYPGQ